MAQNHSKYGNKIISCLFWSNQSKVFPTVVNNDILNYFALDGVNTRSLQMQVVTMTIPRISLRQHFLAPY